MIDDDLLISDELLYYEEYLLVLATYAKQLQSTVAKNSSQLFEKLPSVSSIINTYQQLSTKHMMCYTKMSLMYLIQYCLSMNLASEDEQSILMNIVVEILCSIDEDDMREDIVTKSLEILFDHYDHPEQVLDLIKEKLTSNLCGIQFENEISIMEDNSSLVQLLIQMYSSLGDRIRVRTDSVLISIISNYDIFSFLLQDETIIGQEVETEARVKSTLYHLIMFCFQNPDRNIRVQIISLIGKLCRSSYHLAQRLVILLDRALFVECLELRCFTLSLLWELCYVHPELQSTVLTQDEESDLSNQTNLISYLPLFINNSNIETQLVTIISMSRMLLCNKNPPDQLEEWLAMVVKKYSSINYIKPEKKKRKVKSQPTDSTHELYSTISAFLKLYHSGQKSHQEDIANTIVYIIVEAIEQENILLTGEPPDPSTTRSLTTLRSMLQPRLIPLLNENIITNIKTVFGRDCSESLIKQWMNNAT
jgi:hypothetical protein